MLCDALVLALMHRNNAIKGLAGTSGALVVSDVQSSKWLQVAERSASENRRRNAEEVIAEIQSHSPNLVAQTKLVSDELIRIAILWHEQWHEALEEASRLYFGECDVEGMLNALMPLHDKLNDAIENPAEGETSSEKFFKAVRCRCPCVCNRSRLLRQVAEVSVARWP